MYILSVAGRDGVVCGGVQYGDNPGNKDLVMSEDELALLLFPVR